MLTTCCQNVDKLIKIKEKTQHELLVSC